MEEQKTPTDPPSLNWQIGDLVEVKVSRRIGRIEEISYQHTGQGHKPNVVKVLGSWFRVDEIKPA